MVTHRSKKYPKPPRVPRVQFPTQERPSHEGPTWVGHWALGAPGGMAYFLELWVTIGWVVHLPLVVRYIQGEWFSFPCDNPFVGWYMSRFTLSCWCPNIHPTDVVRDSWEVPLIWPMSWEMRIETIALSMDALHIVVFSMLGCMVFNNLIWDQVWLRFYLCTEFGLVESGKVLWLTLNQFFFIISS